jgi:hypothetical protein
MKADAEEMALLFFAFCISNWAGQGFCQSLVNYN